jgi:hypothetical protein
MSSETEGRYAGEFILAESPGTLSRDTVTVTVPASTTYTPGTVLGQIAATEAYAPYDDAASDGTETAVGILYGELENESALAADDMTGVIVNFGAEVRSDDLVWGAGVDEDAGLADLAARYIKARE